MATAGKSLCFFVPSLIVFLLSLSYRHSYRYLTSLQPGWLWHNILTFPFKSFNCGTWGMADGRWQKTAAGNLTAPYGYKETRLKQVDNPKFQYGIEQIALWYNFIVQRMLCRVFKKMTCKLTEETASKIWILLQTIHSGIEMNQEPSNNCSL